MNLTWIEKEQYYNMYSENFVELPYKIDVDLFAKQIQQYLPKFRDWGERHSMKCSVKVLVLLI